MTNSDKVLEAAQRLGQAHRQFRHARDESERQFAELQSRWMSSHSNLLDELDDGNDELFDNVEEAIKDYLLTGPENDHGLPSDTLEQLEASRAQYAEEVAAADKAIKPAEQALAQPVINFITELRSWLDRSRLMATSTAGRSSLSPGAQRWA